MFGTVRGDITKIDTVTAIVNAANTSLLGDGADGAIRRAKKVRRAKCVVLT